MTAAYRLEIKKTAEREIRELAKPISGRVIDAIRGLASTPRPRGAVKLAGCTGYRVRVGTHRILYTVDDASRLVTIVAVGHRREVYR